jgi:hypothetical protein
MNPPPLARPWVDSPFLPELLEQAALRPEDAAIVRDFARDGYVIFDPQISSKTIEKALEWTIPRYGTETEGYSSDATRMTNAWNECRAIRDIARAPRVMEVLQLLYQRTPIPFQTLNFRVGSQQRTHSDTIHFDSIPHGFMCGVWVALEDIDERSGPLHYYPTSQRLPIFDLHDIGIAGSLQSQPLENYTRYEDFVEQLMRVEQLDRSELRVERGQALIWSANLFHGGSPILDTHRTRHSQVTHYYFEGCLYYTPLMSDAGIGSLAVRNIIDVTTGRPAPQFYNGIRVLNPGEWPPRIDCEGGPAALRGRAGERKLSILERVQRKARTVVKRLTW